MSAHDRTPADLLLLRERRRRMTGSTSEPLLLESDAIVDGFAAQEPPTRDAALHLYRPLASVTLGAMSWTGAIDHATLQRAIACAPFDLKPSAGVRGLLASLTSAAAAPATGEPALHVVLSRQDVDLLESAASTYAADGAEKLALGSLLPTTIVGADAATVDAAAVVLTTYRRASLVVAWLDAIGAGARLDGGADATSRRDEAAAAAMSMLRALLGEA